MLVLEALGRAFGVSEGQLPFVPILGPPSGLYMVICSLVVLCLEILERGYAEHQDWLPLMLGLRPSGGYRSVS